MKTFPSPAWFLLCLRIAFAEDSMMSVGISSSESDSTCSFEGDRRRSSKMNSTVLWDGDWKRMIRSNPYPDICRPKSFASKKQFRFCILEQMWQEELPTVANNMATRRSGYDLIKEIENILPSRPRTDKDRNDCFINTRMKMLSQRQVPFDCYRPYPEKKELDYKWFLYENINDLRFTFDYILYDDTGNTRNEAKFWYLMLYLKKIATELPNPLATAKIIDAVNEDKKNYCGKVRDLRKQIGNFKRDIRYEIRSLLQSIKDFQTNLEVFIHMEKLNINSNIFDFVERKKLSIVWPVIKKIWNTLAILLCGLAVGLTVAIFIVALGAVAAAVLGAVIIGGVAALGGIAAGALTGYLVAQLTVKEEVTYQRRPNLAAFTKPPI